MLLTTFYLSKIRENAVFMIVKQIHVPCADIIEGYFKGNSQFLASFYPPPPKKNKKSGASWFYITFPQKTQKILTEDIIHWLEL